MNRWRVYVLMRGFAVVGATVTVRAGEPSDPNFPKQWGLQNVGQVIRNVAGNAGADIDALAAWQIHAGLPTVTVAIVGRGIDPHIEFSDRLLEGRATVGDLFDTLDHCTHDTHLAGIVAAACDNNLGISGVSAKAIILPVRAFDSCTGTALAVADGVRWAVDHGASVILIAVQFANPSEELASAVAYALSRDAVCIAPVGDAEGPGVAYPAAVDGCLAVSATTNQDVVSSLSNFGPQVDLAAPGRDVWSTWTNDTYSFLGDTRETAAAAAHAAGVAALVRSYAPQLSAVEVMDVLVSAADDLGPVGWDDRSGYGRLNARRALELATEPAIRFEPVDPRPDEAAPGTPTQYVVRIGDGSQRVVDDTASVFLRTAPGAFRSTPVESLGLGRFRVTLPAIPCGGWIEYYLVASTDQDVTISDPLDAPTSVHLLRASSRSTVFFDDFESDQGWEVVGGDNSNGRWSRVVPVGTSAQPGFDHTSDAGRSCFVTGQHFGGSDGTNDVDGGPRELISPIIEFDGPDMAVSFACWFFWSEIGNEDFLLVELSRDGGATWTTVDTIASTGQWIERSFRLSDAPEVEGAQVRVRFSVSDLPSDSLTEAAVDDFRTETVHCPRVSGDGHPDGIVNLSDHRAFTDCLGGLGQDILPVCFAFDFDADGTITLADYAYLQTRFESR